MTIEIRKRAFEVQLRAVARAEGQLPTLAGHAAVFNQVGDGYWFLEKIAPGCFSESIGQDDVRALWNHDPSSILGRNKAGTLRLSEDAIGLAVEIDPPDTTIGRDTVTSISRGDVTQMSFAFETLQDSWDYEGDKPLRTLLKAKLYDVSPVTFPFYAATDIGLRTAPRPEPHAFAGDQVLCRSCGFGLAAPVHPGAPAFDPGYHDTLRRRLDRL